MLERLKEWQEKIDARIMRERVLIFLSALAVLFVLWNFLVQAPFDKEVTELRSQLDALGSQGVELQTQITTVTQALNNDPDKSKRAQIEQLQTDINTVETELHSASQTLIKAEQLPQVLQEVLQKTAQLTLLEVTTLPARELQLLEINTESGSQDKTKNIAAGVYEHSVVLRVSGNYFQIVQFLTALEQLPWRFYWQSLDYSVTQYPNAEMKLRVYTMSAEEGLLGV